MGNENAKPPVQPQPPPRVVPSPAPRSRPNYPSVPPEASATLTRPQRSDGFVLVKSESIPRPQNYQPVAQSANASVPLRSTTSAVNQQQNTFAPQQQARFPPQQQNRMPPEQQNMLPPQQEKTSPPQDQARLAPQQQKKFPPQQQSPLPAQQQAKLPPQQTNRFPPEQQNTLTPEQQNPFASQQSQVPFDRNQIEDNSDNESVISDVSSVANPRGKNYRGRGGKGRGFVQQGGIKKKFHQNYKNKAPNQPINHQKMRDFAKTSATSVNLDSQPSEEGQTDEVSVRTIENQLNKTNLTKSKKQEVINILLLGETGVGKSTFINSIVNYLSYDDFSQAERDKLHILISSSFTAWDKESKPHQITVENETTEKVEGDTNEDLNVGNSATQLVKTYTFTIRNGKIRIRLIDTPGIGDTRGLKQDEINCQNILDYISRLSNLHAICYLFKPDNSRKTPHFNYCVTQMLSRLEKSACNNLVFLFTHTRGTNYTSGETYSLLKDLANEIGKQSDITISIDDSKFCIDNEAFRHLAAVKKGVKFTEDVRAQNLKSWQKSSETCARLIDHILKLKPHMVNSTLSINECRRHIIQLTQPMAEITLLIEDNINQLDRHKAHLHLYKDDLAELKEKLYVPILDVEIKKLNQPVTVCTKCAEPVQIGKFTKWHYSKKCCPNCPLYNVPTEIIGSPELTKCEQMKGPSQTCLACSHHYKLHLHSYYETKIVQSKQVDDNIKKSIENKEALIETAKKTLKNLETRKSELESEQKEIMKYNAKFAYFLQKNALAPLNDSYEEYIQHMITSEKYSGSNSETIASLQKLLNEHKEFKKSFAEPADLSESENITPKNIQASIHKLYKLKHFGNKIKEMYRQQTSNIKQEFCASEYIHREIFKRMPNEKTNASNAEQNAGKCPKKKQRNKNRNNNVDQNNGPQPATNQQHPGNFKQFNKTRGQPNNRGGFQRGGRGVHGNNPNRSRFRGPVQDREAPPPYDVAVQNPPFSREQGQSSHPPQNHDHGFKNRPSRPGYNKHYCQDDQESSKDGTTIQVNVTLPHVGSTTVPDHPRKEQYTQEKPPPPRDDRYATGHAQDYRSDDHFQPFGSGGHRSNTGYDHQRNNYPPPPPPSWIPQADRGPMGYPPHDDPPRHHHLPQGHYPPNTYPDPPRGSGNQPPPYTNDNYRYDNRPPPAYPKQNQPQNDNRPPSRGSYHSTTYDGHQNNRPNDNGPPRDGNSYPTQQGGRHPNFQQQGNQRGQGLAGRGRGNYNRGSKKNQHNM